MVKQMRRRYLAFRIDSERPTTRREVLNLLSQELRFIKSIGGNRVFMRLLEYDSERCLGIIMCGHRSVETTRRLTENINEKNRGRISIQIIGVSGTIKSLKQKYFGRTRQVKAS